MEADHGEARILSREQSPEATAIGRPLQGSARRKESVHASDEKGTCEDAV